MTVEIAHEAEQNAGQEGFGSKTSQIFKGFGNGLGVAGKDSGQQIAPEECKGSDEKTDTETQGHAIIHTPFCPVFLFGTHILGHKRSHALDQRGGNQHDKGIDLLGDAVTVGSIQTQPVHKGADCQERYIGQQILQGQGNADFAERANLAAKADVPEGEPEGQLLSADNDQRKDNTDGLGGDGGDGSTGYYVELFVNEWFVNVWLRA